MESVREPVMPSRASHESTTSGSNGYSGSPSSNTSDELRARRFSNQSTLDVNGHGSHDALNPTAVASRTSLTRNPQVHTIRLSSIEHCMPRAYIRVCLAYRLPESADLDEVLARLNRFSRKLVDSKPYLAGYVVPATDSSPYVGHAKIQFTDDDFLNFPKVEKRDISRDEIPFTYDELNEACLPPSLIRPEVVSALPEGTNDEYAPVFRMQANVVKGGLIVSAYLHHCISDGTGMGLVITGSVLRDAFTFDRHLEDKGFATPGQNFRLEAFANHQSIVRDQLSWSSPNQISNRLIEYTNPSGLQTNHFGPRPPSRGCIVAFSVERLEQIRAQLKAAVRCDEFMTSNDVLQALLWHHMTIARKASVDDKHILQSKLFTPVNIRNKIALPDAYFGAAVDFATTTMPLSHLTSNDSTNIEALAESALAIRAAITKVNEPYIRQAIALALNPDPSIDVRDLMGSNMDRANGADMYITSWEKLGLYDATLELGLGKPDWVRKPWSRDPGSCIILPRDTRKPYLEVLVQMTEADMDRLLADKVFMSYILRTTD